MCARFLRHSVVALVPQLAHTCGSRMPRLTREQMQDVLFYDNQLIQASANFTSFLCTTSGTGRYLMKI